MSGDSAGYLAALDVGTTTLKCQIINELAVPVGSSYSKIKLSYPNPGYVEINHDDLWKDIVNVIKNAIQDASIPIVDIKSLGISTQRATFITWRKDTGEPLHNFITWKDLRSRELIKQTNSSWRASIFRLATYSLYLFTRIKKFAVASRLRFSSSHVTIRLLWVLQNIEPVREALTKDNLMFGTLDTWLIYKLTGGKTYVSDISNASATGLYDPFALDWSLVCRWFNIPQEILPPVVCNDFDFGHTKEDIFGRSIHIGCVMADQSAAMFGLCQFEDNDLKITLGTGAFLDVNTAQTIHPSLNGMYPLVGWKTHKDLTYMSEVPCSDAGSIMEWMVSSGLIDDISKSSDIATNIKTNGQVYFIPAFSGLGPPINNETSATGFIGITPETKVAHMVRAVLESIVYRIALIYNMLIKERPRHYNKIAIDGGVSKNNFICQLLADITNLEVERFSSEMAIQGVAYFAGLSKGTWQDRKQLYGLNKGGRVFKPSDNKEYQKICESEMKQWTKATKRFTSWYNS